MMLFPMAIITLFWKDQIGLSLTEILTFTVFFSVASVVMEYPSGYVSDRLGYRKALLMACLFGIVGWSGYLLASTFWGVLVAELLLGVSYAFISGSDTVLLFRDLARGGACRSVHPLRRPHGRVGSGRRGDRSHVRRAHVAPASPLFPFGAQIVVWVAAFGLCLAVREPAAARRFRRLASERSLGCLWHHTHRPVIRSTIVLGMLLGLASFYMVWLVQPFIRQCGVPGLVRSGLGWRRTWSWPCARPRAIEPGVGLDCGA